MNSAVSVKKKREPLFHLVKRNSMPLGYKLLIRVGAALAAIVVILIIAKCISGVGFGDIWKYMVGGAFGSSFTVNETIKNTAILLAISIALAPAFKMRFWNIGAQGQVLMGGLCASCVVWYAGPYVSNTLLLVLMFFAAIIGGGLWGLIPAIFKVKLNANETLFTLMMNYIAIQLVRCFMDIWKGKNSALPTFSTGHIPSIFGSPYMLTFLLVGALAVLIYVYMNMTKHGYELTVVGASLNTARYAGINTKKVIVRTLILSGAICGFCGFLYCGNVHSIATTADEGYGFTAIIVAWASQFNPLFMAVLSFAIVFIEKGSTGIVDNSENLNSYISQIFVGVFLFFIIGCEFFINYKIVIPGVGKNKESVVNK